jgi:hypothetical protein
MLPFSPGGEAAGVIDANGEGISDLAVGDGRRDDRNGCLPNRSSLTVLQIVLDPRDMPCDRRQRFPPATYITPHTTP